MDPKQVKAAWERAAQRAAAAQGRPERVMQPILWGDVPTFMEAPAAASAHELAGADVAVLGIPYEGVKLLDPVTYAPPLAAPAPEGSIYYRTGADQGPAAIRRHSVFYSLRHGRGLMPEVGRDLVILDHLRMVDYGDVAVDPGDVEATFLRAHEKLADILAAGAVPIVLGGDHSIPIPVLQVLAGKLTGKLGVVTFDSHFDLSFEPKYWAGSQWARAFELGVRRAGQLRADRHPRRARVRWPTSTSPTSWATSTTPWPTSTSWASPRWRRRPWRRPPQARRRCTSRWTSTWWTRPTAARSTRTRPA